MDYVHCDYCYFRAVAFTLFALKNRLWLITVKRLKFVLIFLRICFYHWFIWDTIQLLLIFDHLPFLSRWNVYVSDRRNSVERAAAWEQNGRSRKSCNGTNRITEDIKLSSRRIARWIGRRGRPKFKRAGKRERERESWGRKIDRM